jgi:hypothetical protein
MALNLAQLAIKKIKDEASLMGKIVVNALPPVQAYKSIQKVNQKTPGGIVGGVNRIKNELSTNLSAYTPVPQAVDVVKGFSAQRESVPTVEYKPTNQYQAFGKLAYTLGADFTAGQNMGINQSIDDVTRAGWASAKVSPRLGPKIAATEQYLADTIAKFRRLFPKKSPQISAETPLRSPTDDVSTTQAQKGVSPIVSESGISIPDVKRVGTSGRIIGGPQGISTPNELAKWRNDMVKLAKSGEVGKDWYEKSSSTILEMFQGDKEQAAKFTKLIAIYSPNTTPVVNLNMAQRAWAQFMAGEPITAGGLKARDVVANDFLYKNISFTGPKTNSFYNNLTKSYLNPKDDSVTIDIWAMRALGFTNDTPSAQQYKFAENEIRRVSNKLKWNPEQVQAAMWVATQAENKNVPITSLSSGGFADAVKKKMLNLTTEYMPSVEGGRLAELHTADWKTKMEFDYGMEKTWLNENGVDELAEMLGLPIYKKTTGPGVYEGAVSPGRQMQIPIAQQTKTLNQVDPAVLNKIEQYAAIRGMLTHQDSIGWHALMPAKNLNEANAFHINLGRPLTNAEAIKVEGALKTKAGDVFFISPSKDAVAGEGFNIVKYDDSLPNKNFSDMIDEVVGNQFSGKIEIGHFTGPNGLVGKYGKDYTQVAETVGPDIQNWVRSVQSKKIESFYKEFADKHGLTDIPNQEVVSPINSEGGFFNPKAILESIRGSKGSQSKVKLQSKPSSDIITQAKKEIGVSGKETNKTVKQTVDDVYTQWVDRYNPITLASNIVKKDLKAKGAMLRPEYDPTVLVRRLTGAGGIADARYNKELKPIIDALDQLKIDKGDLDVYLKARRDIGLSARDIKGSTAKRAQPVIDAVEAKYGKTIQNIARQLYDYQDKGFQEMVDAGFISPEVGATIRSKNPDYVPFTRVMDELNDYLGLPTRKTMQSGQPILKIKGSERQVESPLESIIANTFTQRAAIEKNRVAKAIVGLQDIAELGFKKVGKEAYKTIKTPEGEFRKVIKPINQLPNDVIIVWNNGKKEAWKVGQDIAETAKGLNEENTNTLLKIFTAPASLLRQGATGRNPEFMLPNIIRDNLDAGISSKYGYIPFVDYISGFKSILKNDAMYERWASSGAKIDLGQMSGRKSISALFNEKTARKNLFQWVGEVLDVMGKYSETPTRVGLFKRAYKNTGNELLSMMESRDATVDFARMGSKMKVANSIIPFLNVGVQGFDKLMRAVADDPKKVLLNASLYAALPAATTTAYNLLYYPQEYAEIPQYEKDSNFILVTGRNDDGTVRYVTLPKGNIVPIIANPVESFMSYVAGQNQQTFGQFVTQFISSTLPILGEGQSINEVATKTIGGNMPQLIKPITENLMNKSFWKYNQGTEQTKEIVPSYLQKREPYLQSYEWTPTTYKAIGAVLDVSPLQVQNLMEGYLAGYVKIPSQIIEAIKFASEGKEVPANQKTLLRRFMKETLPSSNKPAEQTTKTPLMERITGKTSAAELGTKPNLTTIENQRYLMKSSKDKSKALGGGVYLGKNSGGEVVTIDTSKVVTMPSTTGYEKALREKKAYSMVGDIIDSLKPEDQIVALNEIGVTGEDAVYYNVARQDNALKTIWVNDEISKLDSKDRGQLMKYLVSQRKEVNGDMVLANGVVDQLYEDGVISSSEKAMLKNLKIKNGKTKTKLTGRGKKVTIRSVSTSKATPVKAPNIKSMASLLAKSGKLKVRKVKFRNTL